MYTNIAGINPEKEPKGHGKKILIATVPFDGHVNPITGLAVHLISLGYEVRWYTSNFFEEKIKKLGIHFYPLKAAMDLRSSDDVDEVFPERRLHKSKIAKLNYDIVNAFIARAPEYYEDVKEIYQEYKFDLVIADFAFTAIPFIVEKLKVPVVNAGCVPLMETSKDLAPSGLGMTPSFSILGKLKQDALRFFADKVLFKKALQELKRMCADHNLPYNGENVFDFLLKRSTVVFQSGTPSFEYYRSDIGRNIRFVGPLLPYTKATSTTPWFDQRLNKYEKVVLVTQGTVERDVEKLLVPTLEAFKGSDVLVVVTTGGSGTDVLKHRFPEKNIIIENFIPFGDVMPYADVYVTNGGYGGVLLGIENELPLVVAGVHEGKNEINARIGYFELGVNLKTENPKPAQMKRAVTEVLNNNKYKKNVQRLSGEFKQYNSLYLSAKHIGEILEVCQQKEKPFEIVY